MTREHIVEEAFVRRGTDKQTGGHGYASIYAQIPSDIQAVLEIGIGTGSSLLAWSDLFPKAEIYGIDCTLKYLRPEVLEDLRVHVIECDINRPVLDSVPFLLDLIVDDGSHVTADMLIAWRTLKSRLRGTYVIEDILVEQISELLQEIPGRIVESPGRRDIYGPTYVPREDNRVLIIEADR